MFLIILLTIGYSSFGSNLNISNLSAVVRIDKDIRVTNLSINSINNVSVNYSEYDYNKISSSVNMPNSDSYVIYEVDITNYGNTVMGLNSIILNNSNLKYEILNYNIYDEICNNTCTNGIKKTLLLKISYNNYDINNTNYLIDLEFGFGVFYGISYKNISDNYIKKTIEGVNLVINFEEEYENLEIVMKGIPLILNTDYTFINNKLTIFNVDGNISISSISNTIENRIINGFDPIASNGLILTSLGNSKYELNGTSNNTLASFIRLTDIIKYGDQTSIMDNNYTDVLLENSKSYKLTVNILGGTYAGEKDSAKITFRDNLGNNISNLGYDFKRGYISDVIINDVYMIAIYFGKTPSTFDHLQFEILISEIEDEPIFDVTDCPFYTSSTGELEIHYCSDNLIDINTNNSLTKSVYYIMVNEGLIIAPSINALKVYYEEIPIVYKAGDEVTINYEYVANLPSIKKEGTINYVLRGTDFTALEKPKIVNTVTAIEYKSPISKTNILLNDSIGLSIYIIKDVTFNHYQFYLSSS